MRKSTVVWCCVAVFSITFLIMFVNELYFSGDMIGYLFDKTETSTENSIVVEDEQIENSQSKKENNNPNVYLEKLNGYWLYLNDYNSYEYICIDKNSFHSAVHNSGSHVSGEIKNISIIDNDSVELTIYCPETIEFDEVVPEYSFRLKISSNDDFESEIIIYDNTRQKSFVASYAGDTFEELFLEMETPQTDDNSFTASNTSHIPMLSSTSEYLDADFNAIKRRMGYDLSGPYDEWRNNSASLLYLKNLNSVDCYSVYSEPPELIGADDNSVIFFGVYGVSGYADVKDFLSNESLMVEPAMYSVDDGKIDAFVWKLKNGYLVITALSIPSLAWYDRPAYSMAHVRDVQYISFIE